MTQARRRVVLAWAVWAVSMGSAVAQIGRPVDRRVDGRALDANNQVGSGGLNPVQTGYNPNASNLLITGNVTGGRAFRGFSPVRDTSSFMTTLPTSSLGNFQRDSIGLGDITAGRSSALASPFYLPSSTVTSGNSTIFNTGLTAGAGLSGAYTVPRVDLFTGRPLNLNSALNAAAPPPVNAPLDPRFLPRSPVTALPPISDVRMLADRLPTPLPTEADVLNSRLAESPLFGLPRGANLDATGAASFGQTRDALPRAANPARDGGPRSIRSNLVDSALGDGATGAPGTWAPSLFGTPPARDAAGPSAATGGGLAPLTKSLAGAAGLEPPPASDTGTAANVQSPTGALEATPPRTATNREAPPRGTGPSNEGEGAPADAGAAGGFDPGSSAVQRAVDAVPQTTGGAVETSVNVRLRKAESLMRAGQFYNAAGEYGVAATLAPDDASILLGQGHAYLAAGDYLSAVYFLTKGLEGTADVASLRVNIYDYVSDPNLLDIRRADLDTKLEKREDYRLRFLLGYAEYFGGLKDFGRLQLERAAEGAPADSVIAQLPKRLEPAPPRE
jgi:hypothetical protein